MYWGLTALIVCNIPVWLLIGWGVFDDWAGLWTTLKVAVTPRFLAFLHGEDAVPLWARLKLFSFVISCAVLVVLEASFLEHYMGVRILEPQ